MPGLELGAFQNISLLLIHTIPNPLWINPNSVPQQLDHQPDITCRDISLYNFFMLRTLIFFSHLFTSKKN